MSRLMPFCAIAIMMGTSSPAYAVARGEVAYPFEVVWSAALRLVRVDMGYTIRERDPEAGYMLFDYREGNRVVPGSVEVVKVEGEGRNKLRLIVQIPAMPSYMEQMVLDKLRRKLVAEFGEPPVARPEPPPSRPTPPAREPNRGRPQQNHGTQGRVQPNS